MNDINISVVIPCYNAEKYIEGTLQSIFDQTELPNEIIIVDDGSKDNTVDKILSIKEKHSEISIKLVKQKNAGPGAARNRGIEEASGEWIAFLDSDDKWREEKIANVRDVINKNKDIVLVSSDICEIYESGGTRELLLHERYDSNISAFVQLFHGCFLSTSSVCVLRSILLDVGKFDTSLRSAQDYDLWLRVGKKGSFYIIPKIFEDYLIRDNSVSSNVMLRYECLMRICHKYSHDLCTYVTRKNARKMILRFVSVNCYQTVINLVKQKKYGAVLKIFGKWITEAIRVLKGDYVNEDKK